jgi:hypothetical protein
LPLRGPNAHRRSIDERREKGDHFDRRGPPEANSGRPAALGPWRFLRHFAVAGAGVGPIDASRRRGPID